MTKLDKEVQETLEQLPTKWGIPILKVKAYDLTQQPDTPFQMIEWINKANKRGYTEPNLDDLPYHDIDPTDGLDCIKYKPEHEIILTSTARFITTPFIPQEEDTALAPTMIEDIAELDYILTLDYS